jgi:hypothetical protein
MKPLLMSTFFKAQKTVTIFCFRLGRSTFCWHTLQQRNLQWIEASFTILETEDLQSFSLTLNWCLINFVIQPIFPLKSAIDGTPLLYPQCFGFQIHNCSLMNDIQTFFPDKNCSLWKTQDERCKHKDRRSKLWKNTATKHHVNPQFGKSTWGPKPHESDRGQKSQVYHLWSEINDDGIHMQLVKIFYQMTGEIVLIIISPRSCSSPCHQHAVFLVETIAWWFQE